MVNPTLVGDKLREVFRKETRKTVLNIKPHFLPLDISSLKTTLSHVLNTTQKDVDEQGYGEFISLSEIEKRLKEEVVRKHQYKLDIHNLPEDFIDNVPKYTPAVVYEKGKIIGVLYPSYNSTYEGIFRNFIGKEFVRYLKDVRYETAVSSSGEKLDIKKGFDVGHTLMGDIATTPLMEKISTVLAAIDNEMVISKNAAALTKLKSQIEKRAEDLRKKSSYGRKLKVALSKDTNDFLLKVSANVIIIQDSLENRYYYGTKIEAAIEREVFGLLKLVNFSRNMVEEAEDRLKAALTGKKTPNRKSTKKLEVGGISSNVNRKVSVSSSGTKKPVAKTRKVTTSAPIADSGIANLESLLNTILHDQIKRNMGDGSRKDVLNYRTGRLAKSAKVERISKSREGMITAFYSYMKNPYATFSAGGAQQSPRSRDPKTLIARSIREIGAELAYNRMRAVLV